jgi:hypothetical protein
MTGAALALIASLLLAFQDFGQASRPTSPAAAV